MACSSKGNLTVKVLPFPGALWTAISPAEEMNGVELMPESSEISLSLVRAELRSCSLARNLQIGRLKGAKML